MKHEDRIDFISHITDVQQLKIELSQTTSLTKADLRAAEAIMPHKAWKVFCGVYLGAVKIIKDFRFNEQNNEDALALLELDFELCLFSSNAIDFDFIMKMASRFTQKESFAEKMDRAQIISLIRADSKFIDDRENMVGYIETLQEGSGLSVEGVKAGYILFKSGEKNRNVARIADAHGINGDSLLTFVDRVFEVKYFDAEKLTDLCAPLELCWKERVKREHDLTRDLKPLFHKYSPDIAGLNSLKN